VWFNGTSAGLFVREISEIWDQGRATHYIACSKDASVEWDLFTAYTEASSLLAIKGDLILFLDSDDLVDPSIIREAVAVLRPSVSKVQFRMQTIDALGNSLESFHP
jgi:hypothetical protein